MPKALTIRISHLQMVKLLQREIAKATPDEVVRIADVLNYALRESETIAPDGSVQWILEVTPTKGE